MAGGEVPRRLRRFGRKREKSPGRPKERASEQARRRAGAPARVLPEPKGKPKALPVHAPEAAAEELEMAAQPASEKKPSREVQVAMLRRALSAAPKEKMQEGGVAPGKEKIPGGRAAQGKEKIKEILGAKQAETEAAGSGAGKARGKRARREPSIIGKKISGLIKKLTEKKEGKRHEPDEKQRWEPKPAPKQRRRERYLREAPEEVYGGAEERRREPWKYYKPLRGAKKGEIAPQQLYYAEGKAAGAEKKTIMERAVSPDEITADLYGQLELERKLRKESAKIALREIKAFREEHRRYPSEDEYETIAETIYSQIKETYGGGGEKRGKPEEEKPSLRGRAVRRAALRKKEKAGEEEAFEGEGKEAPYGEAAAAPTEIKELFGEELKKDSMELSEFAEMDVATDESEEDLKLLGLGDEEGIIKEVETRRNKCPTCGTPTEDLAFCSVCGAGFCTHCAAKVELSGDSVKYTCPKCGGQTKVKKSR